MRLVPSTTSVQIPLMKVYTSHQRELNMLMMENPLAIGGDWRLGALAVGPLVIGRQPYYPDRKVLS